MKKRTEMHKKTYKKSYKVL